MIRSFRPADREACADILTRAGRRAFHWANWPNFDGPAFDAVTEDEHVLVAEIDGRIAGFAAVYTVENFLHHLYVDPDISGRGLGKALLDEALRRFGPVLSLKCQALNQPARAFYRKSGWLEDEEAGGADSLGTWLFIRSPPATA